MIRCRERISEDMEGIVGVKGIETETNAKGEIEAKEIITEEYKMSKEGKQEIEMKEEVGKYENGKMLIVRTGEEYNIEERKTELENDEVYEIRYKENKVNNTIKIQSVLKCEKVEKYYNNVRKISDIPIFKEEDEDYEEEFYIWYYGSKTEISSIINVEIYEDGEMKNYIMPNTGKKIPGVRIMKEQEIPKKVYTRGLGKFRMPVSIVGEYSEEDEFICKIAARQWMKIIDSDHEVKVTVRFLKLANGVLGSAGPIDFEYKNKRWYSTEGEVDLNVKYWEEGKREIKSNNKSQAYYTLLHEMGHVLGLGTLWLDHGLLNNGEWYGNNWMNAKYNNALYIGRHGVEEYKKWISKKYKNINIDRIQGVPVEEDGGSGTAGGHIEEGDNKHRKRYVNGIYHPGLDTELMTGYSESGSTVEDMNEVTIGMIKDLGYNVKNSSSEVSVQKQELQWIKPNCRKVDCCTFFPIDTFFPIVEKIGKR
jgi:hypothetical protein